VDQGFSTILTQYLAGDQGKAVCNLQKGGRFEDREKVWNDPIHPEKLSDVSRRLSQSISQTERED